MALDKFGIKEVADVRFYDLSKVEGAGKSAAATLAAIESLQGDFAMEFDTLKVSNIESTAESTDARGGKGNAALISWDYGREVTVTIEDALMSMSCLAMLFGSDGDDIVINANKFPGVYAVVGKTFARNRDTGEDHIFTFVIPKAKIQSETTLTMEAEGDPSVIGMTLKVLRCDNGDMVSLMAEDTAFDKNGAKNIWGEAV